eukprot:157998_1
MSFPNLVCIIAFWSQVLSRTETIRKVENKIYRHKQSSIEFIDNNGLSQVVDFEMTVISTDFGFLEGPVWIPTADDQGYLLFTELLHHSIWKYDVTNKENPFEMIATYPGCGPAAIAWNKNFADEIWIACFMNQSTVNQRLLKVDASTFEIQKSYTINDFADTDGTPLVVDDVVMDSNGNVFFTHFPVQDVLVNYTVTAETRGGVMMVARDALDKIQLVQYLDYAPNGIAINADESIIVASNMASVSLDLFRFTDFQHYNADEMNIFGYKHNTKNNENIPFIYMKSNDEKFSDYFSCDGQHKYLFDSSGFDHFGNLWQSVILVDDEVTLSAISGQTSIFRNNEDGTDPVYVGTIRTDWVFNNYEVAGDGYMYATGGNFFEDTGVLARFKLKPKTSEKIEL